MLYLFHFMQIDITVTLILCVVMYIHLFGVPLYIPSISCYSLWKAQVHGPFMLPAFFNASFTAIVVFATLSRHSSRF